MALHSYVSQGSTFKAKTAEGIEMTFKVTDETAKTCEVYVNAIDANTSGSVTIPSDVNGYKVTGIGNNAFYKCSSITSVSIPSTVTKIGYNSFRDCSSLNNITGGTKVEFIDGGYTFYNTPWFNNLPDGLNYVGRVLLVYQGEMPSDTKINVAEGCTHICDEAIYKQPGLIEIHIPGSVRSMGTFSPIQYCENLSKITVDETNPVYDSRGDCNAIIEKSSKTLIVGCKNTIIPSSVTAIGNAAFRGNVTTWEEVVIPNNIESIAHSAFLGNKMKSILIGKGLKKIDDGYAFSFEYELREIYVSPGNPYFDSRDNCNAIIETATNTLMYGCMNTKIPNTVKKIGDTAFYGNGRNCDDFTSMTIPNSVESIGFQSFAALYNLRYLTIGANAKITSGNAFSYCRDIKTIVSLNGFPDDIPENTFESEVYNNATLYVPDGCRNNYRLAAGWNLFKNIVDGIPSGIESVELAPSDNKSVFTPTGVRLSAPRKGINIINGKKVIVK